MANKSTGASKSALPADKELTESEVPTVKPAAPTQNLEAYEKQILVSYGPYILFRAGKGAELVPARWPSMLKPQRPIEQMSVDMSQPSPFHLIYRDQDYHGPLVNSRYFEVFLKSWGINNRPKCVSICRMKEEQKLLGAVFAMSQMDTSSLPNFRKMQTLTAQITQLV